MINTDGVASVRLGIGNRLRELRRANGMSLKDAAKKAGLSPSFVRLVEKGRTEIGISRLMRLADVYGALLADLLADVQQRHVEFVSAGEGYLVPSGAEGVELSYLASPSWMMEPFMVKLAPGARLTELRHNSEEFIHCLSGCLTFVVGDRTFHVESGDTVVIPPSATHSYSNDSAEEVVVVGAAQAPRRSSYVTDS